MTATRIRFHTFEEAQAFADDIQNRLIAADAQYAESVANGQTTVWAIPYQDFIFVGPENKPVLVSPKWYVNLKMQRTGSILTGEERLAATPIPVNRPDHPGPPGPPGPP